MNFTHRTITENMTIVFPKVGDAVEVLSYAGEVYRFGIYGTSPVIKIGRGARPVAFNNKPIDDAGWMIASFVFIAVILLSMAVFGIVLYFSNKNK